ncbi:Core-2/I-branching beta-1-6-N-acetylglucosaminyltransferase family protein [Striga hermonthica]|uniref:Core-2/I-branching beta-1-6-N-acetylglucosaminyltransferase family protein n=1 Tax=Striga hermonthica TaxID=68872 RepID=A0A9N7NI20_STRHE|nr:Core-2/I-branching beta-1-6-N-acetylglucosaminyltransferase family protein [Striga hermonthica]
MFNAPFALSLALLLSFPLLFLFAPHILPPKHARISLPDELDDIALFRRATLASLDGGGKTQRASPTLISAARRLLATALLDDPSNSYFALVSQYCIPLHSFTYMYGTLFPKSSSTLFPSFIEISSDQPVLWDRYIARGENVMLPEVPFDRFRAGSQFFVLARQHALVVVRDRRLWRKFRLPCLNQDSCYPEEHYFPTLLSMEDPDGCTHYTLTRVNWTGSVGGHPHMYRPEELSPSLIYELRLSNSSYSFMFARKFSPDCLQPLLDIAGKVIFQD